MRILHAVEQYHPSIGGMAEVARQLSERLVARGHSVTVATRYVGSRPSNLINGVKIEPFEISGNDVEGYRWGDVHRYQEFLRKSDFDVVVFFAAQQWATDLALPILGEIKARKVFVPTGFSGLYWPRYKEYFEKLAIQMRGFDANIFLSNDYRDIHFARVHGIHNLHVIPNAACEKEFESLDPGSIRARLQIPEDSFLVLSVGSHNWLKGHLEAMEIFNRSELSNATFLVVGNAADHGCETKCDRTSRMLAWGPSVLPHQRRRTMYFKALSAALTGETARHARKRKRILVRSLSRADTVEAFKAADLFLFASAIECSPLVLFESAASATPFLTTEVGNAKEIISWTDGGWLLPTLLGPDRSHVDVPAAVPFFNDVVRDRARLVETGRVARNAWQSRFTWHKVTDEYEKIYQQGARRPAIPVGGLV